MADANAATKDVAAEMRCSVSTAQRRLKMIGANRKQGRPSKLTDEKWNEIYELVKVKRQGALDQIASEVGLSVRTIERKLKKMHECKR